MREGRAPGPDLVVERNDVPQEIIGKHLCGTSKNVCLFHPFLGGVQNCVSNLNAAETGKSFFQRLVRRPLRPLVVPTEKRSEFRAWGAELDP